MSRVNVSLTILAPAYYRDSFATRYLRLSAERYGVPVRFYGQGQRYTDWLQVQVRDLAIEIAQCETSHVLYTDASDAIVLSGIEEITRKYVRDLAAPPLLVSLEPVTQQMCAGGWMAEREAALEALRVIASEYDDSNPQVRWNQALRDGAVVAAYDDFTEIFQVTGVDDWHVDFCGPAHRVYNSVHDSWPSIIHFAGGYTSPAVGKAALIEPTWRELGYAATVRDEEIAQ